MKYLCRIYIPQMDKANIEVSTYEKALSVLGVTEADERHRVMGLNCEDVYFNGTDNYIRIRL